MDNAGDFVVTWSASGGGSNGLDIWARRYDAAGDPLADAFVVNTTTTGDQVAPAIAMDAAGDFVISWATVFGNPNNKLWTFSTQSFDSTGAARGGQVTLTNSGWLEPGTKLAIFSDASFVAAWPVEPNGSTVNIVYQTFSPSGIPSGSQTTVTSVTGMPTDIDMPVVGVACDASGDIAVAWLNAPGTLDLSTYDASGASLASSVVVASVFGADIAMNAGGTIGVAWLTSNGSSTQQCVANIYSLAGVAQGANIVVNANVLSNATVNNGVSIALDASGDFDVAYSASTPANVGATEFISTAAYDSVGTFVTTWLTNPPLPGQSRFNPALVADSNGDMVLASSAGVDENYAIHAERFAGFTDPASLSGQIWLDNNGNGVRDNGDGSSSCSVSLFNDSMLMSTVTATGSFSFNSLMPGESVYVQVVPPTGSFLTLYNAGSSPAVSSEIDPATGRSTAVVPAPDQAIGDINIGLVPAATIVGEVFSDLLSDGTANGLDPGLPGKTVYLDSNGNGILDPGEPSQLADFAGFAGNFSFSVPPGNYTLRVLNDGTNVDPAPAETASVVPTQRLTVNIPIHSLKAVPAPVAAGAAVVVGSGAAVDSATDANGDSVVAYTQTSGSTSNIFAQRFSSTGTAVGSPFRVNTSSVASDEAEVGIADNGSFIVAWRGGNVVRAQRYAAEGTALGGEMTVDTPASGDSIYSMDVSTDDNGAFAVVWAKHLSQVGTYTFARLYEAAGNPVTDAMQISTTGEPGDAHPSVAMGDDGTCFIVWQGDDAGGNQDVFGRRLDSSGIPQGPQFAISTTTTGNQSYPDVSVNSSGQSAVVWAANAPPSVAGEGVYVQRYDAAGNAIGREMLLSINASAKDHITLGDQGDMLVSWCPSSAGLAAVYVDAAGAPHGFTPINDNVTHGTFGAGMDAAGDATFGYDTSGTVNIRRFVSRPAVLATNFQLTAAPPMKLVLRLSSDVTLLPGTGDVTILNNNTLAIIPASAMEITATSDNTLTITFPGFTSGALPSGSYTFTLPASKVVNTAGHAMNADFVSRFLWVAGTDAADSIILRRSSDKLTFQVFDNVPTTGSPSYTAPVSTLGQFRIDGGAGDDTVTLDFSNGVPFTTVGFSYTGGSGSNSLVLTAATGSHSVVADAITGITFDSTTVPFNVQNLMVDPAGGSDSLGVGGMVVTVPANPAGSGILPRTFSHLNVSNGVLRFADAASPSDRSVVVVALSTLRLNQGTIDLGGNDMIVRNGNLATITSLLQSGSNFAAGGYWNGTGIQSSTAGAHTNTALGVLLNTTAGRTFDNQTLAVNDVVVKYTLNGDSDLDGQVNVADLANLAGNFGKTSGQFWISGDFDYNGSVNVADLADLSGNFGSSFAGATSIAAAPAAQHVSPAASPEAVPAAAATLWSPPIISTMASDVAAQIFSTPNQQDRTRVVDLLS
jgi:hypothetical protein